MNVIELVFENGIFQEHLSNHSDLPATVTFSQGKQILLHFGKHTKLSFPIHLKFRNSGKDIDLQIRIIAEEHSKIVMMEEYIETQDEGSKTQTSIHFNLHPYARMRYYKLQKENPHSLHHADLAIDQKKGSEITLFFADCGSQSASENINIKLRDRDASCHLKGFYYLNQDQQILKYQINVEHMAEYAESSMYFKGILAKKSESLFHGKVHIQKQAQYSKTEQKNHNLLLSPAAYVKTEPHLEIYADDVQCTHGATVGQLDSEALFYLRSRGIDANQSLQMLTEAFAFDVIDQIEDLKIRDVFKERVMPYVEY